MVRIIGLGECAVSSNAEDSIKTYALASCVGLVAYNPKDRVLGMVHIVLPTEKDSSGVKKKEGFFADAAVPLLFCRVFGGYPKEGTEYQVSLFGGCSARNPENTFRVGERNIARIEAILKEHGITYSKKNTGGSINRTIEAFVKDGSVLVRAQEMYI